MYSISLVVLDGQYVDSMDFYEVKEKLVVDFAEENKDKSASTQDITASPKTFTFKNQEVSQKQFKSLRI